MRVSFDTGRAVQPPKFPARYLQPVMFVEVGWAGSPQQWDPERGSNKLTEARREREPFLKTRTPDAGLNTGTGYAGSRGR